MTRKSKISSPGDMHGLLSQSNPSPLRKLLSSHSSIYNALNNSELDATIHTPELMKSQKFQSPRNLPDLQFSITSWQSVDFGSPASTAGGESDVEGGTDAGVATTAVAPSAGAAAAGDGDGRSVNNTFGARSAFGASPSILLSISDDISEQLENSTIVIPYPKRVMVFETDEEEEEDEEATLNVSTAYIPKKISSKFPINFAQTSTIPHSTPSVGGAQLYDSKHDSFIMPRMSLSDNKLSKKEKKRCRNRIRNRKSRNFKDGGIVSILCTSSYHTETSQLVSALENNISYSLNHFNLDHILTNEDHSIIKNSDLIFIINDGSFIFVTQIHEIFQNVNSECLPKLSIINLITVNYFINLFELINNLKPYQIWKTSSLTKIHTKIKDFIELELNGDNEISKNLIENGSFSLTEVNENSSIKKRRPNYKKIEKKFKNELQLSSSSIENIDPLFISNPNGYFNIMTSLMKSLQHKILELDSNKIWLICSFTLGIGIGIGITNESSMLLGNNDIKILESSYALPSGIIENSKSPAISEPVLKIVRNVGENVRIFGNEFFEEVTNTTTFHDFKNLASLSANYLYSLNLILLDNVKGGLEKVFGLFMYINY